MGREEAVNPFKDLKQHSIPNDQIENINMAEAVITHITATQSNGRMRISKPARRYPVYAMVILIVLLASTSVYAATEFIELRYRAGDVKIKSVILEPETRIIPYTRENTVSKPTYRDRVLELIKPGQMLAYYVRDGRSNPTIQYVHNTRILSSYNDFKELLVRTSAPKIKEPTHLPAGFKFKYGSVMPLHPNEHDDRTLAEHTRLLELFQHRAEAEPNKDLFVEEVQWSEANISELEYEKDSMNLRIQAMKDIIGMEITFSSDFTQESLNIGGIETIFASSIINGFKSYEAIWYDETQDTHYQVKASGNVDLSEEQFKLIVTGLI